MVTKFEKKTPTEKIEFDFMSISLFKGEKELLIEHLNTLEHPYGSLSQFVRSGINKKLTSLKSKYQLTIK